MVFRLTSAGARRSSRARSLAPEYAIEGFARESARMGSRSSSGRGSATRGAGGSGTAGAVSFGVSSSRAPSGRSDFSGAAGTSASTSSSSRMDIWSARTSSASPSSAGGVAASAGDAGSAAAGVAAGVVATSTAATAASTAAPEPSTAAAAPPPAPASPALSAATAGGAAAAAAASSSAMRASFGCEKSQSMASSMERPRTATSAARACASLNPISAMDAVMEGEGVNGGGGGRDGRAAPTPTPPRASRSARSIMASKRSPTLRAPRDALPALRSRSSRLNSRWCATLFGSFSVPFPKCTSADIRCDAASPGKKESAFERHAANTAGARFACRRAAKTRGSEGGG